MSILKIKTKFKEGDIVYFKYPSRYSRSRAPGTVEAILRIEAIGTKGPDQRTYVYLIDIIKDISGVIKRLPKGLNGFNYFTPGVPAKFIQVDSLELETYSRHLTSTEKILYGQS